MSFEKIQSILKYVAIVFLPAFSTFYVAMSKVWNLPYSEQISGTIAAIVLFMGMVLQIGNSLVNREHMVYMGMDFSKLYGVLMSSGMYDIIKWSAQIFLPAVATLYLALSQIWGLPYGEQVSNTVMAFVFFLGTLIGISAIQYKSYLRKDVSK